MPANKSHTFFAGCVSCTLVATSFICRQPLRLPQGLLCGGGGKWGVHEGQPRTPTTNIFHLTSNFNWMSKEGSKPIQCTSIMNECNSVWLAINEATTRASRYAEQSFSHPARLLERKEGQLTKLWIILIKTGSPKKCFWHKLLITHNQPNLSQKNHRRIKHEASRKNISETRYL